MLANNKLGWKLFRSVIYNHNIFIIQVTGYSYTVTNYNCNFFKDQLPVPMSQTLFYINVSLGL